MYSALQKVMSQLKGVGKMPIQEAGQKIGRQFRTTGEAMYKNPRASIGAGAVGAGAGYGIGDMEDSPEDERRKRLEQLMMQLEAQGGQGGY